MAEIRRTAHPRPDRVRKNWQILNGPWHFRFDRKNEGRKQRWYAREITIPEEMRGQRVLLHFGAVDYQADVWLDGQYLGGHTGGYTPFTFDLTDLTEPGQACTLTVRCEDRPDQDQPRGKQSWRPEPFSCWYTPSSGIWQSVWLEGAGEYYPEDFRLLADAGFTEITCAKDPSGLDRVVSARKEEA